MTSLLESPAAFVALGLLLVTAGAIPFVQTRSRNSLLLLAATVLLAIGGVVFERAWVTPREAVRSAVDTLFDRIRAGDLPGVLALVDPGADKVRSDAEALMPMFEILSAGKGGEVRVELPGDPTADDAVATARLKPLIKVQHKPTGTTGAYFDGLELDFARRGDRWLVVDYRPEKDWRDEASRLRR
ncbi:hypothetical protein [Botrimarina sp.]|uniref:hypothetical protein n=1 Tax=Botrimarina sp. TaxID=2795802 RepID=UPI0032EAB8EE